MKRFHLGIPLLIVPVSYNLPDQDTLQSVPLLVRVVWDVNRGAARADPEGADWAGEPLGEPRDVRNVLSNIKVIHVTETALGLDDCQMEEFREDCLSRKYML